MRSDLPPSYKRKPVVSSVDAYEPAIRELLAEFPRMPATVIGERVGWSGGRTVFQERVAELRRSTRRPTPASAPSTAPASWPSGTCGSPRPASPSATARTPCRRSSSASPATPGRWRLG